jgi:hypothetical protein
VAKVWRLYARLVRPDPMRLQGYVLYGVAGAAAAIGIAYLADHCRLWLAQSAENALDQSLVLAALLFVPGAVFSVVVGAMFPSYWKASPVSVVRNSPLIPFLRVLAPTVGYGVAAVASRSVFDASWLVGLPVLLGIGIGAILTVYLVGYSLGLLDPRALVDEIARYVEKGRTQADICRYARRGMTLDQIERYAGKRKAVPFGDLCRLLRGMAERERITVALYIMEVMENLWEQYSEDLAEHQRLALRVLRECEKKWGHREYAREAIYACRTVIGADHVEAFGEESI